MRFLAIDYGRKKCGIAYTEGELISSFKTVHTAELISVLSQISKELNTEKIVIGLPTGPLVAEIKVLGETLRKQLACEIAFMEEDFTTRSAIEQLKHTSKKRRREKEHEIAAALILENYLQQQKST